MAVCRGTGRARTALLFSREVAPGNGRRQRRWRRRRAALRRSAACRVSFPRRRIFRPGGCGAPRAPAAFPPEGAGGAGGPAPSALLPSSLCSLGGGTPRLPRRRLGLRGSPAGRGLLAGAGAARQETRGAVKLFHRVRVVGGKPLDPAALLLLFAGCWPLEAEKGPVGGFGVVLSPVETEKSRSVQRGVCSHC